MAINNTLIKLSIITINYNNEIGLTNTINSVLNQSFQDFEYIIIDGNSKDGSKDVILENINRINYWVSEPDNGVYNAMNKGILKAKGDYLLFLNSGDILLNNDVLYKVQLTFDSGFDVFCGNIYFENIEKVRFYKKAEDLNYYRLFKNGIPHPASFINKNLFLKYGLYDESLKIAADWDFFLKIFVVGNSTYNKIDIDISVFYMDGISNNNKYVDLQNHERQIITDRYFKPIINYQLIQDEWFELYKDNNRFKLFKQIEQSRVLRLCLLFIMKILKFFI